MYLFVLSSTHTSMSCTESGDSLSYFSQLNYVGRCFFLFFSPPSFRINCRGGSIYLRVLTLLHPMLIVKYRHPSTIYSIGSQSVSIKIRRQMLKEKDGKASEIFAGAARLPINDVSYPDIYIYIYHRFRFARHSLKSAQKASIFTLGNDNPASMAPSTSLLSCSDMAPVQSIETSSIFLGRPHPKFVS